MYNYETTSNEYKLLYYAITFLNETCEGNPEILTQLAKDMGLPEDTVMEYLETLYTDHPDPDVQE
ncbi:hypothetical protein D3C76_581590 [compost metagenome]